MSPPIGHAGQRPTLLLDSLSSIGSLSRSLTPVDRNSPWRSRRTRRPRAPAQDSGDISWARGDEALPRVPVVVGVPKKVIKCVADRKVLKIGIGCLRPRFEDGAHLDPGQSKQCVKFPVGKEWPFDSRSKAISDDKAVMLREPLDRLHSAMRLADVSAHGAKLSADKPAAEKADLAPSR